jgi:hypothetical protein
VRNLDRAPPEPAKSKPESILPLADFEAFLTSPSGQVRSELSSVRYDRASSSSSKFRVADRPASENSPAFEGASDAGLAHVRRETQSTVETDSVFCIPFFADVEASSGWTALSRAAVAADEQSLDALISRCVWLLAIYRALQFGFFIILTCSE